MQEIVLNFYKSLFIYPISMNEFILNNSTEHNVVAAIVVVSVMSVVCLGTVGVIAYRWFTGEPTTHITVIPNEALNNIPLTEIPANRSRLNQIPIERNRLSEIPNENSRLSEIPLSPNIDPEFIAQSVFEPDYYNESFLFLSLILILFFIFIFIIYKYKN